MSLTALRGTRRWRLALAVAGAGALAGLSAAAPGGADPGHDIRAADPDHQRPIEADPDPPVLDAAPLSEQFLIAASQSDIRPAPEPDAVAAEAAEPEPAPEPATEPARSVWDRVADCESGSWTGSGGFVEASANWSSTEGLFEGGLQFHPDTWDGYRDPDMPAAAYDATREQQIVVAERVLADQGWRAWPVCSRKLGLR